VDKSGSEQTELGKDREVHLPLLEDGGGPQDLVLVRLYSRDLGADVGEADRELGLVVGELSLRDQELMVGLHG